MAEEFRNEGIDRRFDFDRAAAEWVEVFEADGAKSHGRGFARAVLRGAVHGVADDWQAGVGEVNANLMGATGEGPGFDQSETFFAVEDIEKCFGLFAFGIDAMTTVFFGVGAEFGVAEPFVFFWTAAHDCEVTLVHAARFEKVAEGIEGALAFGEEQNAGGFGVEAVDVFQEFEITRTSPKFATENGGGDGKLKVPTGAIPRVGNEHPAGGFVDSEDGAIFVKDWDGDFVPQLNDIRPRHWLDFSANVAQSQLFVRN